MKKSNSGLMSTLESFLKSFAAQLHNASAKCTLECRINVAAEINVSPGKIKRTPWKVGVLSQKASILV